MKGLIVLLLIGILALSGCIDSNRGDTYPPDFHEYPQSVIIDLRFSGYFEDKANINCTQTIFIEQKNYAEKPIQFSIVPEETCDIKFRELENGIFAEFLDCQLRYPSQKLRGFFFEGFSPENSTWEAFVIDSNSEKRIIHKDVFEHYINMSIGFVCEEEKVENVLEEEQDVSFEEEVCLEWRDINTTITESDLVYSTCSNREIDGFVKATYYEGGRSWECINKKYDATKEDVKIFKESCESGEFYEFGIKFNCYVFFIEENHIQQKRFCEEWSSG